MPSGLSVKHHGQESAHRMHDNMIRVASSLHSPMPPDIEVLFVKDQKPPGGSTTTPPLELNPRDAVSKGALRPKPPRLCLFLSRRRPLEIRSDCTPCVVLSATENSPA